LSSPDLFVETHACDGTDPWRRNDVSMSAWDAEMNVFLEDSGGRRLDVCHVPGWEIDDGESGIDARNIEKSVVVVLAVVEWIDVGW
jgi:hypothetical protein